MRPPRFPMRPGRRVCSTCRGRPVRTYGVRSRFLDALDGGAWVCPACEGRGSVPVPLAERVAGRAFAVAILLGWRAWCWAAPRLDRLERAICRGKP